MSNRYAIRSTYEGYQKGTVLYLLDHGEVIFKFSIVDREHPDEMRDRLTLALGDDLRSKFLSASPRNQQIKAVQDRLAGYTTPKRGRPKKETANEPEPPPEPLYTPSKPPTSPYTGQIASIEHSPDRLILRLVDGNKIIDAEFAQVIPNLPKWMSVGSIVEINQNKITHRPDLHGSHLSTRK